MSPETAAPARPPADGVYPPPYFHQRIDEEAHRASRMHAILTCILIQGNTAELAHKLRLGIRRMDSIGMWKEYLAVLLAEIPREEVSPLFEDRLRQQAEGVLRIAGIVDTEWQEVSLGACVTPDQKGGKVEIEHLLGCAEKALAESALQHRPVIYRGLHRLVEIPRREMKAPLLRFGDLHLSKDDLKAWVGSDSVDLLPKELDLLLYMLKHEGKLVKRDNLSRAVWGYEYFGTTRTIDMHRQRQHAQRL